MVGVSDAPRCSINVSIDATPFTRHPIKSYFRPDSKSIFWISQMRRGGERMRRMLTALESVEPQTERSALWLLAWLRAATRRIGKCLIDGPLCPKPATHEFM